LFAVVDFVDGLNPWLLIHQHTGPITRGIFATFPLLACEKSLHVAFELGWYLHDPGSLSLSLSLSPFLHHHKINSPYGHPVTQSQTRWRAPVDLVAAHAPGQTTPAGNIILESPISKIIKAPLRPHPPSWRHTVRIAIPTRNQIRGVPPQLCLRSCNLASTSSASFSLP
jgi:hypothetical protein